MPRTSKAACARAIVDEVETVLQAARVAAAVMSAASAAPPRRGRMSVSRMRRASRSANENLRRHMLATEAIMRGLAVRLGDDPDSGAWPVSRTTSTPRRPRATSRATAPGRRSGSPSWACRPTPSHAVAAHNPATGAVAESRIDVALIAADQPPA